jgi:hypothetical protein
MLAAFAAGSEDPRRRAEELIAALAADPRWTPTDIAGVRTGVEEYLLSGHATSGVFLLS